MRIVVVRASGDIGRRVVAHLCNLGHTVVGTTSSPERVNDLDPRAETAIATITDEATMAAVLANADRVINLAHADTTEQLIPLLPPSCQRYIGVGSAWRYSAVPSSGAAGVRRGEAAFLRSGLPGCMLHPTMIYGGDRERNIGRIIALLVRWPRWLPLLWPVPGGGIALTQPVYVDDVASAIVAAATTNVSLDRTIVIAGARALPLAELLRACAAKLDRRLHILPVPTNYLIGAVRLLTMFSIRLPISVAELQRSKEEKSYDIGPMRSQLGVEPRSFEEGLSLLAVRHLD